MQCCVCVCVHHMAPYRWVRVNLGVWGDGKMEKKENVAWVVWGGRCLVVKSMLGFFLWCCGGWVVVPEKETKGYRINSLFCWMNNHCTNSSHHSQNKGNESDERVIIGLSWGNVKFLCVWGWVRREGKSVEAFVLRCCSHWLCSVEVQAHSF